MSDIILVGGSGYIGTALSTKLQEQGISVDNIDVGIYKNMEGEAREIEALDPSYCTDKAVIWLAGFHRELDVHTENPKWEEHYQRLMVDLPDRWAGFSSRFFYISSMRAVTEQTSLYGQTKARAEGMLLLKHIEKMTVMRFGTVWGAGSPFRANTAVNFALSRGEFTGTHWTAHVTHRDLAVDSILFYVNYFLSVEEFQDTGEIMNIIDPVSPLDWRDIRELLAGTFEHDETQELFNKEREACSSLDLEEDLEAIRRHRILYGLEVE